jgi:hypothetical protein
MGSDKGNATAIIVALIGLMGVITAALIGNWNNIFPGPGPDPDPDPSSPPTTSVESTSSLSQTAEPVETSVPGIHEDCIRINPGNLQVMNQGDAWYVTDGRSSLLMFHNERDAWKAQNFLSNYRIDSQCFVGRPDPSMHYYLSSGRAPSGSHDGEDCLSFNPGNLRIIQQNSNWQLVDGNHSILSFPNRAEADVALTVIRKYGFEYICFVGRPNPPMMYFRK